MPAVVLVGHGHACPACGPVAVASGSERFTFNGRAVARVGDTTDHEGTLENGDASWLIN
ncbi:PAAR domain-containing protein [Pseudomonas sp. DR208]|uniref:PAAR domain-containing protein n=1 Tax=Pseudomonas sp. DR208 TaxID=2870840 RepID=UPI001C998AC6|nr:PAAR domain-containing protein [Pseudomonas sp. DR208]QZP18559.1 PAAR domain-containing protein [Pseudomonas sp. DR208]